MATGRLPMPQWVTPHTFEYGLSVGGHEVGREMKMFWVREAEGGMGMWVRYTDV